MILDRVDRSIAELSDGLALIRKLAAQNLARYGDARAVPALRKAAQEDPEEEVKAEAKKALEKLAGAGASSSASAAPAPAASPRLSSSPLSSSPPFSSTPFTLRSAPLPWETAAPSPSSAPDPFSPRSTPLPWETAAKAPLPWETAARVPLPWETPSPAPSPAPPPAAQDAPEEVTFEVVEDAPPAPPPPPPAPSTLGITPTRLASTASLGSKAAPSAHAATALVRGLELLALAEARAQLVQVLRNALSARRTEIAARRPATPPAPEAPPPRRIQHRPEIPPPEPPSLLSREETRRRSKGGPIVVAVAPPPRPEGDFRTGVLRPPPGATGGPSQGAHAAGARGPRPPAPVKKTSATTYGCLILFCLCCICPVAGIMGNAFNEGLQESAREREEREVERVRSRSAAQEAENEALERRASQAALEKLRRRVEEENAAARASSSASASASATEERALPPVIGSPFRSVVPSDRTILQDGSLFVVSGFLEGKGWAHVQVTRPLLVKASLSEGYGRTRFTAELRQVPPGTHRLVVEALRDSEVYQHEVELVVDEAPPKIISVEPADGSSVRWANAKIVVRFTDESRISARLGAKRLFTNRAQGTTSFETDVDLAPGENVFEFSLEDEMHRDTSVKVRLYRGVASPVPEEARGWTIRVHPKDQAEMMLVPEGPFLMGGASGERSRSNERPAREVTLAAYTIDRYPVTQEQYRRFARESGRAMPKTPTGMAVPEPDDAVAGVTWEDAAAYAAWAGKRLPTEAEWEKAARGDDARPYPWGAAPPSAERLPFDDKKLEERKKRRPLTKAFPQGGSAWGCYDMVGCVRQWCADVFDAGYYAAAPTRDPQGPARGSLRVLRGSAAVDAKETALERARTTFRMGAAQRTSFPDVGFRCAVSAKDWPK